MYSKFESSNALVKSMQQYVERINSGCYIIDEYLNQSPFSWYSSTSTPISSNPMHTIPAKVPSNSSMSQILANCNQYKLFPSPPESRRKINSANLQSKTIAFPQTSFDFSFSYTIPKHNDFENHSISTETSDYATYSSIVSPNLSSSSSTYSQMSSPNSDSCDSKSDSKSTYASKLSKKKRELPVRSEGIDIKELLDNVKKGKNSKNMFCTFCKNNNEKEEVYTSHLLKDSAGKITCPILKHHKCPICGAHGGDAHTITYYKKYKNQKRIQVLQESLNKICQQ